MEENVAFTKEPYAVASCKRPGKLLYFVLVASPEVNHASLPPACRWLSPVTTAPQVLLERTISRCKGGCPIAVSDLVIFTCCLYKCTRSYVVSGLSLNYIPELRF